MLQPSISTPSYTYTYTFYHIQVKGTMMHTAEFFQILCFHDSVVWCTPQNLTLLWDAHRRAFLKIRISWRNRNRIRNFFGLFIRDLDGFESWKKWRLKISWHTPFNIHKKELTYLVWYPLPLTVGVHVNPPEEKRKVCVLICYIRWWDDMHDNSICISRSLRI